MGVMTCIGSNEVGIILTRNHSTRVNQHTTTSPRTYGRIAISVTQGGIATSLTIFRATESGIDHHILIANLADAASLEELHSIGDKTIQYLTTFTLQIHRLLVKFKS